MADITTHGSPETFDVYIQGAIDALLSSENDIPDYESYQGVILFNNRVPLKSFIKACQFINKLKIDEQLWIVPTSDGKIKIQFSE